MEDDSTTEDGKGNGAESVVKGDVNMSPFMGIVDRVWLPFRVRPVKRAIIQMSGVVVALFRLYATNESVGQFGRQV